MRRVFALTLVLALTAAAPAADESPIVTTVKAKLKDPSKPFTMLVFVKVKGGMESKFEAAFADAIQGTRKEKGNLAYQLNRSADDESTYAVYERWKSLDALREHVSTPHIEKLLKALPDLIEGPPQINVGFPVGE